MNKKELFNNSKATATMALIPCLIYDIVEIIYIFNNIEAQKLSLGILGYFGYIVSLMGMIALPLYFTVILLRLFNKTHIKIKNVNYITITLLGISFIVSIGSSIYGICTYISYYRVSVEVIDYVFLISNIISIIISLTCNVVNILYLFNILIRKVNIIDRLVNNKVYAITNIAWICYSAFKVLMTYILYNLQVDAIIVLRNVLSYVQNICLIPYFYNYYKLLKGESNGK